MPGRVEHGADGVPARRQAGDADAGGAAAAKPDRPVQRDRVPQAEVEGDTARRRRQPDRQHPGGEPDQVPEQRRVRAGGQQDQQAPAVVRRATRRARGAAVTKGEGDRLAAVRRGPGQQDRHAEAGGTGSWHPLRQPGDGDRRRAAGQRHRVDAQVHRRAAAGGAGTETVTPVTVIGKPAGFCAVSVRVAWTPGASPVTEPEMPKSVPEVSTAPGSAGPAAAPARPPNQRRPAAPQCRLTRHGAPLSPVVNP